MPRGLVVMLVVLIIAPVAVGTDPTNAVLALQAKIDRGGVTFRHTAEHGHLKSLLKELGVPESSQLLVFSKTSFQSEKITPRTPRALYFADDVYVGYVPGGEVVELSAPDPELGTAFYTFDQKVDGPHGFARHTDSCLRCHGGGRTNNSPGHVVRSVFPDPVGRPIFSAGSTNVDPSTPLTDRWGGWYVTGTHGAVKHRGNWLVTNDKDPDAEDRSANQNLTALTGRFPAKAYLTPHSDIVALMVFEHQTDLHNRLARAAVTVAEALRHQEQLNKELKEKPDHRWASVTRRIELAAEDVVRGLLFCGEAKLTDPVKGTSGFAVGFEKRGPADTKGRSLRQFDLNTRLFRYPCSYLIHTRAFDDLPAEVKVVIWKRLGEVLYGADRSDHFKHLTAADRIAVRDILIATKKDIPAGWGR
jgi:hypothetical protein